MTDKTLQNCGKCGLCLNACPVYKILKEEQVSPRAKLQLIKAYENDNLATSAMLKEIVSKCLMCGSCAVACPSGIDHYSEFMEMRQKMVKSQGETPAIKSLIYLLAREYRTKVGAGLARTRQKMVKSQGETPAIKSLIYLLAREYRTKVGAGLARTGQKLVPHKFAKTFKLGNIPLKNFPKLNAVPFRKACDTIILPNSKPDYKPVGTIVYFTGCATNYIYDDTGFATIGILKHLGYKIIIPKGQTCCSIPLLFHGARDLALDNIKANIAALKGHGADQILVDCSTCGEALKNEYPKIMDRLLINTLDAKKISSRVMDVLSFIDTQFDRLGFDRLGFDRNASNNGNNKKLSVTYHAPCHSKNSFQSHTIIENLLQKLPFVDYKRALDVEECCGGGGTFFYEYPEISKKMVDKKIKNAKAVEASHWLTDCPVCRMNLNGNLNDNDNLLVQHPVNIIYSALKHI